MSRFLYRLFFPVAFLAFVPGLLWKLKHRPGYKATYGERFGKFSPERVTEVSSYVGAVWLHSVSVGETMIALSLLKEFRKAAPQRKFVLSTTTTTAQQLARDKAPEGTAVIFCPLDFTRAVRRVFDLIQPSMLVIFETEIWPNLIWEAQDRKIPCALVNARMSDHSAKGYRRFRCFFGPLMGAFHKILAQSETDAKRYASISSTDNVINGGNLKFDQKVPQDLPDPHYETVFGEGKITIVIAASTHPGEEAYICDAYQELKKEFPELRLVIAPRHAERGAEVQEILEKRSLSCVRRSLGALPERPVEVLLADTTGELLMLMKGADVVLMGKSFAGESGGHNLIEPALLKKAIVTGDAMTNFRALFALLLEQEAVVSVGRKDSLTAKLRPLLSDAALRCAYGERACAVVAANAGAVKRAVSVLEEILS